MSGYFAIYFVLTCLAVSLAQAAPNHSTPTQTGRPEVIEEELQGVEAGTPEDHLKLETQIRIKEAIEGQNPTGERAEVNQAN